MGFFFSFTRKWLVSVIVKNQEEAFEASARWPWNQLKRYSRFLLLSLQFWYKDVCFFVLTFFLFSFFFLLCQEGYYSWSRCDSFSSRSMKRVFKYFSWDSCAEREIWKVFFPKEDLSLFFKDIFQQIPRAYFFSLTRHRDLSKNAIVI